MFMPRMMQLCVTLLIEWLASSTVHGDVLTVTCRVSSDGIVTEKGILLLEYVFI